MPAIAEWSSREPTEKNHVTQRTLFTPAFAAITIVSSICAAVLQGALYVEAQANGSIARSSRLKARRDMLSQGQYH
jgi:hypothetical protein